MRSRTATILMMFAAVALVLSKMGEATPEPGDGQDGARYVINVPGRGYCFVGSTARSPAGESAPAPIRHAGAVHSLPSRLKRMVGRQTAVEAIAAQLARTRFVTIVGPGGTSGCPCRTSIWPA
jgi:hypothetical protein